MNENIWQTLFNALMDRADKCIEKHKEHFKNEEFGKAQYWAKQLAEIEGALAWVYEQDREP